MPEHLIPTLTLLRAFPTLAKLYYSGEGPTRAEWMRAALAYRSVR